MRRKRPLFAVLVVIVVLFMTGVVLGQPPVPGPLPPPPPPPPPAKNVDMRVFNVGNRQWEGRECSACSDILSRVDAIFLNDLTVGVYCDGYSSRVREATGTVRVTYYDLSQGRTVTKTKSFTVACMGQPRDVLVQVVNHPLLIKRSSGIRAEVIPGFGFRDTNRDNNTLTERDPNHMCVMEYVY